MESRHNHCHFDEDQWIKMLFVISDTQQWLNDLAKGIFYLLPLDKKKNLFRKTFYITASSFAHILERHYYKIQRFPDAGKFTVPAVEILCYLRDCFEEPPSVVPGTLNTQRVISTERIIGFDQNGQSTNIITAISDPGGRILTAFPGTISH